MAATRTPRHHDRRRRQLLHRQVPPRQPHLPATRPDHHRGVERQVITGVGRHSRPLLHPGAGTTMARCTYDGEEQATQCEITHQVRAHQIKNVADAVLTIDGKAPGQRTRNHHRPTAQRERLEDVGASAKAPSKRAFNTALRTEDPWPIKELRRHPSAAFTPSNRPLVLMQGTTRDASRSPPIGRTGPSRGPIDVRLQST